MSHDRISQEEHSQETGINSLLERASNEAGRILRSIQTLAGTTSCKGVQIAGLKKWAISECCWIEDKSIFGTFSDRGSENEVYMNVDKESVYKLNDFRYADDNLTPFFERIRIHNILFPDCAYTLVGFAENKDGKVCAVLTQPFIRADREASKEEIAGALALMGFIPQQEGEYYAFHYSNIYGKLFNNKDGERLVNVALSRAKHKLIVIGDTRRFMYGTDIATVGHKVSKALYNIHDVPLD